MVNIKECLRENLVKRVDWARRALTQEVLIHSLAERQLQRGSDFIAAVIDIDTEGRYPPRMRNWEVILPNLGSYAFTFIGGRERFWMTSSLDISYSSIEEAIERNSGLKGEDIDAAYIASTTYGDVPATAAILHFDSVNQEIYTEDLGRKVLATAFTNSAVRSESLAVKGVSSDQREAGIFRDLARLIRS